MKRTRASNFNKRVTIQQGTDSKQTTGEVKKTWAAWKYRWASIEPLTGREWFEAQQFQSEISVKIKIRHDSSIDAMNVRDYRFTYDSVVYEIIGIINQYENDREMCFMCRVHNG